MRREFIIAVRAMIVTAIAFGLIYPLAITGIGQVIFPGKANGSLIKRDGVVVGSALIGQQFYEDVIGANGKVEMSKGTPVTQPDPKYFQTRPSGTVPADNAEASSFANYGPNSTVTLAALQANVTTYLCMNASVPFATCDSKGFNKADTLYDPHVTSAAQVPVDAADTSASGVDPDISVANAKIQAYRVAAVRHLSLATVDRLVSQNTTARSLDFLGEPGVDVLELNLALDRISNGSK
ncbi:MAG: potassium-transporting ATPase subunit C [Solirubrobacteraceae bacterium]|jgi:K+-transporting ATPase ATPase C chain